MPGHGSSYLFDANKYFCFSVRQIFVSRSRPVAVPRRHKDQPSEDFYREPLFPSGFIYSVFRLSSPSFETLSPFTRPVKAKPPNNQPRDCVMSPSARESVFGRPTVYRTVCRFIFRRFYFEAIAGHRFRTVRFLCCPFFFAGIVSRFIFLSFCLAECKSSFSSPRCSLESSKYEKQKQFLFLK